ncbi:hypothetical protein FRC01_009710, partial [Tulasnella sp. 417]
SFVRPIDGLCTEWKVGLAFTVLTLVSLLSTLLSYLLGYPDNFFNWVRPGGAPRGMSTLLRRPRTPPPPWTPSESLLPLLPQGKLATPSELETVYDAPDDGPYSVEDYRQRPDDLEQGVNKAEADASGYTDK